MKKLSCKQVYEVVRQGVALLLLGGMFPVSAQEIMPAPVTVPAESGEPVVIQAGSETVTRSRFEQDFQLAMVMLAAESGTPIKNQGQIELLRRRYLDQRARNLALLALAEREGISAPAGALERAVKEYLDMLGIEGAPAEQLSGLGFTGPGQLREKLQERLIVEAVLRKLDEKRRLEAPQTSLDAYVALHLEEAGLKTYPDRLAR